MRVEPVDLDNADVVELVRFHHAEMQGNSPPDMCFPLDLEGLRDPRVTVLGTAVDGRVVAIGAMKRLDSERVEIKSMRTHPDFVRLGLAGRILEAIIDMAIGEGFHIVSLETGSAAAFAPARALYHAAGFHECPPFGSYGPDPLSVFMTRTL